MNIKSSTSITDLCRESFPCGTDSKSTPFVPLRELRLPSETATHGLGGLQKLPLHEHIQKKLDFFYQTRKIPNIIFHGSSGSGKRTIVYDFLNKIYGSDKHKLKTNAMLVNCAHGKGIKFIREELKFFAKTNIQSNSGVLFKSIILLNADSLTIDAQSALRRCIELFSHNTRFFIIVGNKHKLLNPILSRFCEIYVPEYIVDGKIMNLHKYNGLRNLVGSEDLIKTEWLSTKLRELPNNTSITHIQLVNLANELYENGYSSIDLIGQIETMPRFDQELIANVQMCFEKVKLEFRCEKMLMFYIMDFLFLRENNELKNVSFI